MSGDNCCIETISVKLFIGSKRYSSWSLRPWLLMRQFDIHFSEEIIPFENYPNKREFTKRTIAKIKSISPSARVPSLHINNGKIVVHDSLAICETLNELYPDANMWPEDFEIRSQARSIANELHTQFAEVRKHMPLCCGIYANTSPTSLEAKLRSEIDRLEEIIGIADKAKKFLFGRFSIADAMLAPYILRLHFYRCPVLKETTDYTERIINNANVCDWVSSGASEDPLIDDIEHIATNFPDFGLKELKL